MRSLGRAPTELEVKEYQKSVDKGDGSFNIDGVPPPSCLLASQYPSMHSSTHPPVCPLLSLSSPSPPLSPSPLPLPPPPSFFPVTYLGPLNLPP